MMDELRELCAVVFCMKRRKGKQYCSMHEARLQRTGRLDKKTPFERMMERVEKSSNGCWNYTRYINDSGYGRFRVNGKKVLAHRFSYESNRGAIPKNKYVLHTCDNPACVNPDHLYLGTSKDNARDMAKRNRQWLQRAKNQGLDFDLKGGKLPDGYTKIR